jgi:hypothetical protein
MRTVLNAVVASAALLALGAAAAVAQVKPPPPGPSEGEAAQAAEPLAGVNHAAFREAYERANRPPILTLVGFGTGDREARGAESALWNTDPSGFTFQLRSAFNEFVNGPRVDVELISATQLADAANRLRDQLAARGEHEAVRLLAAESRAELVVLIRLFGERDKGEPTRGQLEVTNARGRELFSYPFQWAIGSTDTAAVREVARRLAIAFTDNFIVRPNAAGRWTVRVFGLEDVETVLSLRSALEQTPGIGGVMVRRAAAGGARLGGGGAESYRELEVVSDADALEVETLLSRALKPLGFASSLVSVEGGVVNVRATAVKPAEVPPSAQPTSPSETQPAPAGPGR